MEMIQIDDIKVMAANVICMVLIRFEDLNNALQAILILATITYTIARTINEVRKIKDRRKTASNTGEEEA